ncbi:hypothetical protein WQ54_23560 [Bacillus sp. SA1-12]|uniref:sugar phosphate isomerase/epimerase family protein n=1 Tax=Bacillus sp. SA1-12 TaxID=1455638 RepID=UPI0006271B8D|nr:TIM barrel protein [Bacillus sp. SA1-12]KKI90091.1 hypothetical protein WQ54_23560 [Bacillus sp. SA1-12]
MTKEAAPIVYRLCKEYGLKTAVENHPEKHPDEIKAIIGDYGDVLGAAVDTGWFATQGYSAPDALRQLKDSLLNIHLKDVKASGSHFPVPFGTGIANIEECVLTLKEIGYDTILSIEQESAAFDPTNDCKTALQWISNCYAIDRH